MAGHTFISHASGDAAIASKVCAALERRGLPCWMAPRDVPPGGEYADALVSAIKASDKMVVIFTTRANESPHVMRKVERAITHRIPIVPVRLGGATATGSMEYLLATPHWLDLPAQPGEAAFDALAAALRGAPKPGSPRPARPLGLMGAAVLQAAVAMHALALGTVLLSITVYAPPAQREAWIALLPYGAAAIVIAAGLAVAAAGLLFRQAWARHASVILNLSNVPFQLMWNTTLAAIVGGAHNTAPFQMFAILISLALVVYLFQPAVRSHFASTA